MLLRFISTIVLAPPALAAIWFGWPYFDAMVFVIGVIAVVELYRVSNANGHIQTTATGRIAWPLVGLLYVGVACAGLLVLRADAEQGRGLVVAFFAVVWATDIGAYLIGRAVGGPKLAPAISPKKTWSGAIGGAICAIAAGFLTGSAMDLSYSSIVLLGMAGVISVVSQIGDLVESWWKRRFDVKDSGNLIPGHGGILDRIDGVLLASPVAAASHWLAHGGSMPWK